MVVLFPLFAVAEEDFYQAEIRPIFDGRCIACHSCFDSPCQLNLQTLAGAKRGAFMKGVYDGTRLEDVAPTRMFEDASSTEQWRSKGFYEVMSGGEKSILIRLLDLSAKRSARPTEKVRENVVCTNAGKALPDLEKGSPHLAMPYGFPALSKTERDKLAGWIAKGAPGPIETLGLSGVKPQTQVLVRAWEELLNKQDLRSRVVGRYLFEHFFLAHFHTASDPGVFLRLVRSTSACEQGIRPVNARRPNDDPGVKKWHYCFYRDPASVVLKSHIPYEMSDSKLAWIKENFFGRDWKATKFPSFEEAVAKNPFLAFQEIPAEARYRFLLQDARYHVMTFIRGPVCSGNIAVNVIQERFLVAFLDPSADPMLNHGNFAQKSASLMVLPGEFDAQPNPVTLIPRYRQLVQLRNEYRELRNNVLKEMRPKGFELTDIWGGDGKNPNALLTVFRHEDNAEVVFGQSGDLTKTVFMLDYSIFERLVYNLVVNFDVFGNVKHQALTRLYMDLLRMEAEVNYLEFLPKTEREELQASWYRGIFAPIKLSLFHDNQFANVPSKFKFKKKTSVHLQMVRKILFERMTPAVRGPDDVMNWKQLSAKNLSSKGTQAELRKLSAVRAVKATPFARFFPEFSLVSVGDGNSAELYSIVRDREHENIAWMLGEGLRLAPEEDMLTIRRGVLGPYPNRYFVVGKRQVKDFVARAMGVRDQKTYDALVKRYGVDRMDPAFWKIHDGIQKAVFESEREQGGHLDLSRYDL